jgi:serine/threonine protein kinase
MAGTASQFEESSGSLASGALTFHPSQVINIMRRLADDVGALHESGLLHRDIGMQTVTVDDELPDQGADAPRSPMLLEVDESPRALGGWGDDVEFCPPELRHTNPVSIPVSLAEARAVFQKAGLSFDPRRIDVYQLGTFCCRLLTGGPVDAYLRSPRARAKVPQNLRTVIDGALGYEEQSRIGDVDELFAVLNALPADAASAADRSGRPLTEAERETPSYGTRVQIPADAAPSSRSDTPRRNAPPDALCLELDAERRSAHSHAERGNEEQRGNEEPANLSSPAALEQPGCWTVPRRDKLIGQTMTGPTPMRIHMRNSAPGSRIRNPASMPCSYRLIASVTQVYGSRQTELRPGGV